MTDIEAQQKNQQPTAQTFERWILRDALDVFGRNFSVVLSLLPVVLLLGIIGSLTQNVPQFIFQSGDISALNVISFTAFNIVHVVVSSSPWIFLVFVFHSSILEGKYSWEAVGKENKKRLLCFMKRWLFAASIVALLYTVAQLVLLFSGITPVTMQANAEKSVKLMLLSQSVVGVICFVLFLLLCTWPVSVLRREGDSLSAALSRGRKVAWYVLGKNLMVLPVMFALQAILFWSVLPFLLPYIMPTSSDEVLSILGMPVAPLVVAGVLGDLLASAWCAVEAVIISRAYLIGDSRLGGSFSDGEAQGASAEGLV